MTDIRSRAEAFRKIDTHNRLAVELHRDPDFDFAERRVLRVAANEALELQSRVGHVYRVQGKIEWSAVALTDLRALIERLEYAAKTAREIEARLDASEPVILQAAE